jgi:Icc-related predicted phosphoesterase
VVGLYNFFPMNILHISDTHCFHDSFPYERFDDIDLIIHSGDCSNSYDPYANEKEVRNFIDWFSSVPVRHKIFVAGNHDTSIEKRKVTPADFFQKGIVYLENQSTTINGIKFWGSPITPTFGKWAFMKARDKTNKVWQLIPDDTDVVIVHGPPKGVRDLSYDREGVLQFCGCSSLMKRCWSLGDRLKLVCFGHIHNMKGVETNQGISQFHQSKTVFSNASCVVDGKFDLGLTSFGNILVV